MSRPRPTVDRVRRYFWIDHHTGNKVPGIALMGDTGVRVHLTPDEAIQVANDIADTLEGN